MIFRRTPKQERRLTGVGAVLSASHRDQVTGQVHGHTWEITAWFIYDGTDQSIRKYQLNEVVDSLDHRCLPDKIAWGEALAKHIGTHMPHGYGYGDPACVAVEANRPLERIYARWEADK